MLTRNSNIANTLLGSHIGLCVAILLYAAMAWCSFVLLPDMPLYGSVGVCFPSPNEWDLSPAVSFALTSFLAGLCVFLAAALNARFSIIPGTGTLYAVMFLVAVGAVPWITQRLTSAFIVAAVTLICLRLLFPLYGRKNASQGVCVIFSLLSWGSMVQYAFVLLMPIFMLGVIFMGVMRLREFIGMLLGIACPYWIMIGLGVVSPETIGMPALTNLLHGFAAPGALFFLMLGQGLAALLTLLLTTSNALTPSTTGQQHRSYIAFINLLGIAMVWFLIFDSSNMLAYTATLALCLGFQAARFAAIPRHKLAYLPVLVAIPAFITIFIFSLL